MSHLMDLAKIIVAQKIAQNQNRQEVKQTTEQIIEKEEYIKEAWAIDINITDQLYEFYQEKDGLPWTAVTIENKGPSNLYYAANHWKGGSVASLEEGESYKINFDQRDSIKKLFLKCDVNQQTVAHLHIIK